MADWLVDSPTDPRRFPEVRHRHANGTLTAIRDRTPTVVQELRGPAMLRWSYACPCGDVYVLERPR
jgi:hypothetical protein